MSPSVSNGFVRELSLAHDEQRALAELARSIQGNPYVDFESYYQSVRAVRSQVPRRVARTLDGFRSEQYAGSLLVSGLPLGDALPRTPDEPFTKSPVYDLGSEFFLVLLATLVAQPFSYKEWDGGLMVHNKYPIRSHRNVQFGSNAVEFLLHTETPFRSFSPDYLALLCLRGDPAGVAMTKLCDVRQAIFSLAEEERDVLRGAFFAFKTDNPAIEIDGMSLTQPMPIITSRNGEVVFEYVHDLVAVTRESGRVLEKLKSTVEKLAIEVSLQKGQLIIIDNSHMIHGRSAYDPKYDGSDRWLQRLLLSSRLFDEDGIPDTRLIPDRQLAHYPTDYRNVLQSLAPTSQAG